MNASPATIVRRVSLCLALALGGVAGGLLAPGATLAYTVYVSNWATGSVTPINTATNTAGSAIAVGANPTGIAITPDGSSAYVANNGSGTVTPIHLATGTAGSPIAVGSGPVGVAITPDGRTAYVANYNSGTVTPINIATNTAGSAIAVGFKPGSVAITPDGSTAYVASSGSGTVTPIHVATNTPGPPITVGAGPISLAIAPDGKTAYVVDSGGNAVTPITLATATAGAPIAVGIEPIGIAISPDGASAYVADSGLNTITPIALATGTPGAPITVDNAPFGVAITPDGASAYVANTGDVPFTGNLASGSTTVTGIASTARLAQGMPVTGNGIPNGTTIAAPPGANSITLSQAATATMLGARLTAWGQSDVSPVNLGAGKAGTAISTQSLFDTEVAITPDQAPVASFRVSAAAAGSASTFDASSSTVAFGAIKNFHWEFGDGAAADTANATITHTYSAPGTYAVTLTETDTAGTSTTQVFTGQTMSLNGGASARTTLGVSVPLPKRPKAVVVLVRSLTITRAGNVVFPLSCPRDAAGGCHGTITLRLLQPRSRRKTAHAAKCARGCRMLGHGNYEARAGQKVKVRVHMASFGRRLLARRGAVRASVLVTNVAGSQVTSTQLTVSVHARRRHA